MKKQKKNASEFVALNSRELETVKGGGYWMKIVGPDGKTTIVWVP